MVLLSDFEHLAVLLLARVHDVEADLLREEHDHDAKGDEAAGDGVVVVKCPCKCTQHKKNFKILRMYSDIYCVSHFNSFLFCYNNYEIRFTDE